MSHTATVENKRLSHALRIVKAQQDLKHTPAVRTNSDKGGYQKRSSSVAPRIWLEVSFRFAADGSRSRGIKNNGPYHVRRRFGGS